MTRAFSPFGIDAEDRAIGDEQVGDDRADALARSCRRDRQQMGGTVVAKELAAKQFAADDQARVAGEIGANLAPVGEACGAVAVIPVVIKKSVVRVARADQAGEQPEPHSRQHQATAPSCLDQQRQNVDGDVAQDEPDAKPHGDLYPKNDTIERRQPPRRSPECVAGAVARVVRHLRVHPHRDERGVLAAAGRYSLAI